MIRKSFARVTVAVASALLFSAPLVSGIQASWADDTPETQGTTVVMANDGAVDGSAASEGTQAPPQNEPSPSTASAQEQPAEITPAENEAESDNTVTPGWNTNAAGERYLAGNDGSPVAAGWYQDADGAWYMVGSEGVPKKGWLFWDGSWFWLNPAKDGRMATGVAQAEGSRYAFGATGRMATSWILLDGSWYLPTSSGALATGWAFTGGAWYWLDPATAKMATGVIEDGGHRYLLQSSGAMSTGWATDPATGRRALANGSGALAYGWQWDGSSWYYMEPSTGLAATGWLSEGGARYHLDAPSGRMRTGWVFADGAWYYLSSSGAMVTGWLFDGCWYYLHDDGIMASNEWVGAPSDCYLLTSSGAMATSQAISDSDGMHYVDTYGHPVSGWQNTTNGRFYFDPNNAVKHYPALTGLNTINGKDYYFDPTDGVITQQWVDAEDGYQQFATDDGELGTFLLKDGILYSQADILASGLVASGSAAFYATPGTGVMALGATLCEDGITRYFDITTGIMRTGWINDNGSWRWIKKDGTSATGWLNDRGTWYLLGDDGVMETGWQLVNGKYYFLDSSGAMHTGWLNDNGAWYWLDSSGAMKTGWVYDAGRWYWLNEQGKMHTGWLQLGNDWFYLAPGSGEMYTGLHHIDGVAYLFDSNGYWRSLNVKYWNMFNRAQGYYSSTNWLILVDTNACTVAVYNGSRGSWAPVNEWICSPGTPWTPTVTGEFTVTGKGYSFGSGYTCYYYTQFYGDYLFHSVLYNQGTFNIQDGRLGQKLSHGCVRLAIQDAKWIYDNIPYGTKVVTY